MGDMTKNFSRKEFACPCCGKDNINNKLVDILQTIRDAAGVPVTISSGVRCAKRNKAVGGVENSAHLTGEAADIWAQGMTKKQLGAKIKELHEQGKLPALQYCYLIADGNRAVHVGIDKKKRSKIFGF